MTFDEYEKQSKEVEMFRTQVQCAICGVLGINPGDTVAETFQFYRTSDVDVEYHLEFADRRKSIERKLDIALIQKAMDGEVSQARKEYLDLYCQME